MKIAFIPPILHLDYLANTVIDGLLASDIELAVPAYEYRCPYDLSKYQRSETDFLKFAESADLIILASGKSTNYELVENIGRFDKTVFIDGSELGKNRRYDQNIRTQLERMEYDGQGAINAEMLSKCALYFRREKPYIQGVIPFPYGIESRFIQCKPHQRKDIDFVCIFGQDMYPPLRREVRGALEKFCEKNGFSYRTSQTKLLFFNIYTPFAQRRFHRLLAHAKVGISVGGGGFDTLRFWEILANDCMLMTETIDIYEEGSTALKYDRISEFKDLGEFEAKLGQVADFLRNGYDETDRSAEYSRIVAEHSSKARVMMILEEAAKKNVIKI